MRRLMLAVVVIEPLVCGGSFAAGRSGDLHRPQVDVRRDPPAYYSDALYEKMDPPGPHDWRAAHPEPEQTFTGYLQGWRNRPVKARHTIVLVPLGSLPEKTRKDLAVLREYVAAYYTLPVQVDRPASLREVTSRRQSYGEMEWTQYLTGDILRKVLRPRVKRDTFCLLGVTMEDLYPEESWNYVFGQASLSGRVGVYSLVRFYPAFWGEEETPEAARLALKRSLKTLVHETGHMFGVKHCKTYDCVMNGSNHLAESDGRPLHLCPECLKKFRWNIGFDVAERYRTLKAFYEKHGFEAEAEWLGKRIAECGGSADGAEDEDAPRRSPLPWKREPPSE